MSDDKKDLTRIEDLAEFIHELNSEEDDFLPPDNLPATEELPDIPESDNFSSFSSDVEESSETMDFGTTEESPSFETTEDSDNFSSFSSEGSTEELSFGAEESSFENTDFSSDVIDDSPFTESTQEDKEETSWDQPSSEPLNETSDWDSPQDFSGSETEEESESEAELRATPEPSFAPSPEFKAPETFEDLKRFSESSSLSGMATEGNPSFSVLLKNVRYVEDVNDIVSLLRELNLLSDSEEQTKGRLMRGMLLIPRISEFAAIFIAHKLRRFDIDILVGLSDEIHPPKHQETPETGIVSKSNLFQNQTHHFNFDNPRIDISQIIVAATQTLEGYQVVKYVGVASEHKMLDSTIVEDEASSEIPRYYQELAQRLKAHALKGHANAVVGLNYQLTPIPNEFGMVGHKYRLTCTGNLVWVNKL